MLQAFCDGEPARTFLLSDLHNCESTDIIMLKSKYRYTLFSKLLAFIPNPLFCQIHAAYKLGYWVRLKHPRSFNEYVTRHKLETRDALVAYTADKYLMRDYVTSRVGGGIYQNSWQYGITGKTLICLNCLCRLFSRQLTHAGIIYSVPLTPIKNNWNRLQSKKLGFGRGGIIIGSGVSGHTGICNHASLQKNIYRLKGNHHLIIRCLL